LSASRNCEVHQPSGLVRAGMNLYDQGLNSGEPEIGIAGAAAADGDLRLPGGSNVDMAQEFTNMILGSAPPGLSVDHHHLG
jgi:flagellar hook protein FlgE